MSRCLLTQKSDSNHVSCPVVVVQLAISGRYGRRYDLSFFALLTIILTVFQKRWLCSNGVTAICECAAFLVRTVQAVLNIFVVPAFLPHVGQHQLSL